MIVSRQIVRPQNNGKESSRLKAVSMRRICACIAVGLLSYGSAYLPAHAAEVAYVAAAVNDPNRPPEDKARDANRKPLQTLSFAGIKPGDKVVDLLAGDGYWTRILSRLVGPKGNVYAIAPILGPPPWSPAAGGADNPVDALLAIQRTLAFENVTALLLGLSAYGGAEIGLPEQVDMVWSADAYHVLHNKNGLDAPLDLLAVNQAIFRVLKPGGIYYVVDFATTKGTGFSQTETLQRADAKAVKAEVLAAGFVFDGESQALSVATDDHALPVQDNAAHPTDRFAMRFKKPLSASADKRRKDSALANYFGNTFMLGPTLRIVYHADHTYQETYQPVAGGPVELTAGRWYFDADGHVCLLHQSERMARGFVICHPFTDEAANKRIGDHWTEISPTGATENVSLVKGIVFPY